MLASWRLSPLILLAACTAEQPVVNGPEILAGFHYDATGNCRTPELVLNFYNDSRGAIRVIWDFGDGTTSSETNPIKIYPGAGKYVVRLTALSQSDTATVEQGIHILRNSDGTGPYADFVFSRDSATLAFHFSASADSASYDWDMGDGTRLLTTRSEFDHNYPGPGRYSVFMVATDNEGSNCMDTVINVSVAP